MGLTFAPADHLERPTDRAISEHLFILRKKANAVMGKAPKGNPEVSCLPYEGSVRI